MTYFYAAYLLFQDNPPNYKIILKGKEKYIFKNRNNFHNSYYLFVKESYGFNGMHIYDSIKHLSEVLPL